MSKIVETKVEVSPPKVKSISGVLQRNFHNVLNSELNKPMFEGIQDQIAVKAIRILAMTRTLTRSKFRTLGEGIIDNKSLIELTADIDNTLIHSEKFPPNKLKNIESAYSNLLEKLNNNNERLIQAEMDDLKKLMIDSIKPLGYNSITSEGKILRFANSQTSIKIESDGAGLKFDFNGFNGRECDKEAQKVFNKLREQGFVIKQKKEIYKSKKCKSRYEFNPLKLQENIQQEIQKNKNKLGV